MTNLTYKRQLENEIDHFHHQDRLHINSSAADWRNSIFIGPMLLAAFGYSNVHEIYASQISSAIKRSSTSLVYSLGCGDGEQELAVLTASDNLGFEKFKIIGIELSPSSANKARINAEKLGLSNRFEVIEGDLNLGLPSGPPVAAYMIHHVLHHVIELELLLDNISNSLHCDGELITFDMIGRNGHMLWPELKPIIRQIWSTLPKNKRYDFIFNHSMASYEDWDCSLEGFEGIRSQDILRIIDKYLKPEKVVVWGGLSQVFLNNRVGPNFDPNTPLDCKFIALLHQVESMLLLQRQTTPVEICGSFRPKNSNFSSNLFYYSTFKRSIRLQDENFKIIDPFLFSSPYTNHKKRITPILKSDFFSNISSETHYTNLALIEGFSTPDSDGVYALLDEQLLNFYVDNPVSVVVLHLWILLDSSYSQVIEASAFDCDFVCRVNKLEHGSRVALEVYKSKLLHSLEWNIKITSNAYRNPNLDLSPDKRPLTYKLLGIETR
jgi:SAM-dependent methyltransferase